MTQGAALAEGYLVSDRFQLLRLLGRGGMGSVWIARHLSLKIEVAIKFIDGPLGGREDLRSRFAQEARTAARIQSPHVVNILDYGFDGVRPFIVMELLRGEALNVRLERERRLAPGEVSTVLTQAARGLGRAHSLGIVHRDLKPDNLFLAHDEDAGVHVKLLDFGIARDETPLSAVSHRTGTGQLLGTPAYMSPEQALGKPNIDFRSDLYSLAVVVFHCVTGQLPFDSEAMGELLVAISLQEPPRASSLVLGLSPAIDAWFWRAFQKEPSARFGSAKEMAEAFALACSASVSSAAYDRTVLAHDGATTQSSYSSAPPTSPSTGAVPTGTPAPTAAWSPAGPTPPPRTERASLPAQTAPSFAPPPLVRTAPWSPPVRPNPSAPPPPPPHAPMAATGNAASVRIPDTFNGQSATQAGDQPALRSRGPAPLVLALIGLVLLVAVGGVGVYEARSRAAVGTSGTSGTSAANVGGSADGVSVPSALAAASAPPSEALGSAPALASPSASASASAPPAPDVAPPPAPVPSPALTQHHSPARPPAPPAVPPPRPKPAPTNDYGL